jgi:hypothetical protein
VTPVELAALKTAIRDGIREGIDPLVTEVLALRTMFASGEPEPESPADPPGCVHPNEARVDFSAGTVEEWECSAFKGGCGYRHRAALEHV